jgi:hypothetical protein
MGGDFHQQPQQQAGKPQRVRPQVSRSTLGLRHDLGMPPHPHIAQDQGHSDKQQPQGRLATRGTDARLMHLPVGRLNTKTTPVGGAKPTQGARPDTPGGIAQRLSPVTTPLAPRVGLNIEKLSYAATC